MENFKKRQRIRLLFLAPCLLPLLFFGCIRLQGSAGYYKKGPEDESPKARQVGFDTQKLIPNRTPGSITMDKDT